LFTFTRSQLRQFRAVLRRAGIGKPSGSRSQQIVLLAERHHLHLQVCADAVAVRFTVQSSGEPDPLVLPLEMLHDCEGRAEEPVTFRRDAAGRIVVEWSDRQIPQRREYDSDPSDDLPGFPALPEHFAANPPSLWSALADAVRSANRSRSRFALDCLELRGQSGQIAATDGRQALVQTGFAFPWTEDVLIPALPVLGCPELFCGEPFSIGRTEEWVTLVSGPWSIALRIEKEARFPDISGIIPAQSALRARIHLMESDAVFLTTALPRLPAPDALHRPVTVELNGHVALRGRAIGDAPPTELRLSRSRPEGEPLRVQMNREFLARALQLGFREIGFTGTASPALCHDGTRQFVWALLEPEGAISADPEAVLIESPRTGEKASSVSPPKKEAGPHRARLSRSHGRRHDTTASSSAVHEKPLSNDAPPDPLEVANSLKEQLRSVLGQVNRLAGALKQQRRQRRLVRSTLASLRQLQDVA